MWDVEREIHSNQCQCLPTYPHWALATWAALSPSTPHVKVMSPMTVVAKPELGSHKTKCSEITKVQQILCCSTKLKLSVIAAVTLILKMNRTAMNTCTLHVNLEKITVNFLSNWHVKWQPHHDSLSRHYCHIPLCMMHSQINIVGFLQSDGNCGTSTHPTFWHVCTHKSSWDGLAVQWTSRRASL